ncbi:MAG: Calx-beta domain-containing protein [Candidatus Saccharibacteria bacterium]
MKKINKIHFNRLIASLVSILVSVSTLLAGILTPIPADAVVPTTVLNVGDLGSGFSRGNAINDQGQVAGYSYTSHETGYHQNAFLWSPSTGTENLGSLNTNSGPSYVQDLNSSMARGLNNNGQVVGSSTSSVLTEVSNGDWRYTNHAFVWTQSTGMVDLGVPNNSYSSEAVGINDNGQIIGTSQNNSGPASGWLWENGTFTTIPCIPDDINDSGIVAGAYFLNARWTACTWDSINGLRDLGIIGGPNSWATGINAAGQVVGRVEPIDENTPESQVFIWDPFTGQRDMSEFDIALGGKPAFITEVNDINDSMQVTGSFLSSDTCAQRHVFAWDPINGVTDIGTDGYITVGDSINNSGQVAGYSQIGFDAYTNEPCISPPTTSSPSILMSSAKLASTTTTATKDDIATLWSGNKSTVRKISVGGGSIVRGDSGTARTIQFPVTLSVPSRTNVTVSYAIASDGTGTALPTTDFVAKTGKVTFRVGPKGYTPTTLWVNTLVKPSTTGGTKTFKVTIGNPIGEYTLNADGTNAVGTILQRSGSTIRASVGDTSIWEGDHGNNAVKVWVNLSAPATSTITLNLSLVNGSAQAGSGYKTFSTKTVKFLAGQRQKSFTIYTQSNLTTETNKNFSVVLSNPSMGLTIDRGTATINILNDD